ncbi:hypothetical protein [Saccharopolyspora sp. ASAGF58]|uniref:hypothetical protein n=1 Tax=Saccharopolyspora sp. ASAGF58 TaxID=2719023 RepID=UPI00144028ED|nr:hypothetical protein [Saccharopolyspora sp. ASAGF58]QIZ34187.1 hypothetical protein FDZ84_04855 [Saccharopolyspora sp. ASAGF58]
MLLIFATTTDEKASRFRATLGDITNIEFRTGAVKDTAIGCDAILIKFYLAHDRYGGTPKPGVSQVLPNSRNDGLPALIVTTLPFPPGDEVADPSQLEDRFYTMFAVPMTTFNDFLSNQSESKSLHVHREGLGLDSAEDAIVAGALRRAVLDFNDRTRPR